PPPAAVDPPRQAIRAAEVTITSRRLVPAPLPLRGEEPAPQAEAEPEAHGLSAPRPIEVAAAAPRPLPVVEDAPALPGDGVRKPAFADPGCMERSLRLPPDLAGRYDGSLTVKFPVAADGTVGRVEVLGGLPDPRLAPAVEAAIRACRFLPGADAQGRPTALWVVMPLRFVAR
ncbi:MAG TPA: TonB family protein, partial [Anaeromyxobacteraceae bacterium]|nr:TonB family protein [Anaeromyxobacteraceae bacterium]